MGGVFEKQDWMDPGLVADVEKLKKMQLEALGADTETTQTTQSAAGTEAAASEKEEPKPEAQAGAAGTEGTASEKEEPKPEQDNETQKTETEAGEDPNSETWKHKYDVLKGMHQAKERQIQTEAERKVAELERSIHERLEKRLRELEAKLPGGSGAAEKTVETPIPSDAELERMLTEQVGPDLAKIFMTSNARTKAQLEAVKADLSEQLKPLSQTVADRAQREYDQAVFSRAPQALDIAGSEEFQRWMGKAGMNVFWAQYDNKEVDEAGVPLVVQHFKNFANTKIQPTQAAPGADQASDKAAAAAAAEETRKRELAAQAAPRSRAGTTTVTQPRIFTDKEIQAIRIGIQGHKYTDAEAEKLEKEIRLAAIEGRVKNA